jgi:hypothetical protein
MALGYVLCSHRSQAKCTKEQLDMQEIRIPGHSLQESLVSALLDGSTTYFGNMLRLRKPRDQIQECLLTDDIQWIDFNEKFRVS